MKKILIIDDKEGSENVCNIVADTISKNIELTSIVIFGKKAETYFKWDAAGNNCRPLFKVDDFEFVFIHHSQKGDSLYPSTIIDLIKFDLGEKLVLFSGSIDEHFLDETGKYINRSIKRNKLNNKVTPFINKSYLIKEWILEFLFYEFEFEEVLIRKVIIMLDNNLSHEHIFKSSEMKLLLKLLYVDEDSSIYNILYSYDGDALINELKKLLYD